MGATLSAATTVGVGAWMAPAANLTIDQGLGALLAVIAVNVLHFPAVALIAFFMGRPSVFVGSLIPPVVIFAWSAALMQIDVTEIQPQLSRELKPESRLHRLVILEPGLSECDVSCIAILSRTDRDVAIRADDAKPWRVFRKLAENDCQATPSVQIHNFSAPGYVVVCAAETSQDRIDDALIIRWVRHRQGDKSDFLPDGFDGMYQEAWERNSGTDRFLGRWVEGYINSRFNWMLTFFEADSIQVAPYSKLQEFHSALLGVDVKPAPQRQ